MTVAGLDPANAFPWDPARPPYPGMLAFEEKDAAVFFGRAEEIARGLELLNRVHHLGEPRTVVVLGGSGTGKSSLVRAGLVPRLRHDPDRWLIVDPIRPRLDPFRELAAALSGAFGRAGSPRTAEEIAGILRRDDRGLLELCLQLKAGNGRADAKVLLVIDQFEELLTAEKERDAMAAALRAVRRAADDEERSVVLLGTLRSDFLDRFQNRPEILDIGFEVLSLGPMSQDDVAEIVTAPAREANLEIEPALVDALVADAAAPNALPLLAFALRELWERYGQDRNLTLREYRDGLGGLQMVVGRVAEDVITTSNVSPAQEKELRAAFMAMLRISAEGRYVRRVRNWSDFPDSVRPLLERFVEARLLASGVEGANTLEVAHERLFGSWKRLETWISENMEALRLRDDIERAAQSWSAAVEAGQDGGEYLWRGERVTRARELMAEGTLLLDERERRFVEESHLAAQAEAAERERQRRRRFVAVLAFGVIALALAVIAGYMAFRASTAAARADASATSAAEREQIANVARMRALAAQNFAEHQRVNARAQVAGIDADVKQALLAIAPKYLDQSKRYEATAQRMQKSLEQWRAAKRPAAAPAAASLFSLEVMRAESGTAFLVHYGDPHAPRHILIDGGKKITFSKFLRPRFEQLRAVDPSKQLPLDLVVASQTDAQHMEGLTALIDALKQRPAAPYKVSALWSNAFVPNDDETESEEDPGATEEPRRKHFVDFQPKARLVLGARELHIPVNSPFSNLVMRPEAGAARINWAEDLSITVLSPPVDRMRQFATFWLRDWRKRPRPPHSDQTGDYDILENFASPVIELLPSPMEVVNPDPGGGLDKSLPNLSSIVLMLERGGKRMLFTADTREDLLLASLAQAGYTDEHGAMEVDIVMLPHGGSDRNVSEAFFRRVKASDYVISADGTYGNPELTTLKMLFDARRSDPRPFTIVLTYTPAEMARQHNYPGDALCRFFSAERARGTAFDVIAPQPGSPSVGIDLLFASAIAPKGTSAVCP